jgi:hypothetical protein
MQKAMSSIGTKVIALVSVLVLALSLSACGGGKSPSKEELVGTWQQIMSDGTETVKLTSDGRYISDIKLYDGISSHNEHTWDYSDGKLTVHYKDLGVDSTYKVVISDNEMKLSNGNSTVVYTKK